ncbi:MAG: hypothetical protein COB85_08860, partial [Bacteroidetes bacterium]
SGRKYWLFYPPEQTDFLYEGTVDGFDPDLDKYPYFAKTRPLLCIQNPGEIVFTPSGWYHQVRNEGACISFTENFINETNIREVKAYFERTNMIVELGLLNQLVSEFGGPLEA